MKTVRCQCLVLVAVLTTAGPAAGQGLFDSYRTFSMFLENDALAKWQEDTTDESYTQGLRMTWEFAAWPDWVASLQSRVSPLDADTACTPQHTRGSGGCGTVIFGLGQTMYSPVNIVSSDLQTDDQPFAGWLFGTAGLTARKGRWQSSTEFVIGVTGPPSLARNTQSLAHWTWAQGAAKPGGWDHQLKTAVLPGAMQSYAYHLIEKCDTTNPAGCSGGANERRQYDLSPRAELVLTMAMVRASGGLVARYGRNIPDSVGARIPATAPQASRSKSQFFWAVFAAVDARAVGHNAFLSGSYADGGAEGWSQLGRIDPRRFVNERSAGVTFGTGAFAVSVEAVSRSLEWDPIDAPRPGDANKRHSYMSLKLSLNSGR
jgi:lipid A 3-O-deacylase